MKDILVVNKISDRSSYTIRQSCENIFSLQKHEEELGRAVISDYFLSKRIPDEALT